MKRRMKKMTENRYSVKIRDGAWIKWCGFGKPDFEQWYETCKYDNRIFTKEEAEKIAIRLREHYIYKCWLCSDAGEELITVFKPEIHKEEPKVTYDEPVEDFSILDDDIMALISKKAAKL